METSLDLLAWRDALSRTAAVPSAADLVEWSGLLADTGHDEGAALLCDVAALHQGFSPQMMADRKRQDAAHRPFGRVVPDTGDDAPTRAISELQALGRSIGTGTRPDAVAPAPAFASGIDIARVAGLLRDLLERPCVERPEDMKVALATLVTTARQLPAFDHRAFATAPLSVLVPAIATMAAVDFALRTRDLWDGPSGSPALLHRMARFDEAGLGSYLANVGRLARRSRDVIAMARIACEAAQAGVVDTVALTFWTALLSRGCAGGLLREVVDDLGDVGAGGALTAILDREASRLAGTVDIELIMRLRDAGLDNADQALAMRAQEVIVRLRPDSVLEGVILGSIEASAHERGRAESTFRHWLARSPDYGDLRARMDALQAGRFEPFVITRGFGSPADRQATRLRRRGILPDHRRRRGERIAAVAVH